MWLPLRRYVRLFIVPRKLAMNKTSKNVANIAKTISNELGTQNFATGAQFQVLDTPVKSDSDKKEYKVIRLNNGLVACLISDKSPITEDDILHEGGSSSEEYETESEGSVMADDDEDVPDGDQQRRHHPEQKLAAAALCIGVGSFSDSKDVPGMAHFLEHMVFMGSEKYPQENAFDEFISKNGGSNNASTDSEATVFYFEILEKYLDEALDRFSQFFKSPLMKREAMTREREAIESEFQMAIPSDSSRKEQLLCSLSKVDCPVNNFSWGNLITLKETIDDEKLYKGVHEFRKRHYSANRMTLAIQARMPIEELENYVINHFSQVPTNGLPADDFSCHKNIFDTPAFNKIYYITSVKDINQVDINFILPPLLSKYKTKPAEYISHLLGDEGKGSLLSYLKKRCWAVGAIAGIDESGIDNNTLHSTFKIIVNLTEEGYVHLNDVIETVFSYIKLLQASDVPQRIHKDLQLIADISFKYANEETAVDIVEDLCESMQTYPPKYYLTGSELYFEFDIDGINQLLKEMVPERVNIMVLKQDHKIDEEFCTEKWFGTRYIDKDIPESWMQQWKNAPINPELTIPPPNEFITKDFTILPDIDENPEYPKKVIDDELIEFWYRRDMKFKLPVGYYYFYLISPLSTKDCKNACILDTFINVLQVNIAEDIYPATTADLSYTFASYEKGLKVKFWGFNEKLPILSKLIGNHLLSAGERVQKDIFEAIKDKLIKSYYNMALKPSKLAKEIRLNLLVSNNWNSIDRYNAMQTITYEEIKEFSREFFKTLYVKCLVQGNIDEATAQATVQGFIKHLNYTPLNKNDQPKYRIARLNKGEKCLKVKNINPDDSNSIITNYYQSDIYTVEQSIKIDLIMMAIEEPLFNILRTKEQLGYHVYGTVRDTFGVLGYTITVNSQATKSATKHVNDRIEAFIKQTEKILKKLSNDEFQEIKDNLIKVKKCSDVHLKEEVDRNWSEITNGDYIFDRIPQEILAIEKTSLADIRTWWAAHNSFGNKESFRKLSIQVEGYSTPMKTAPKLEIQYLNDKLKTKTNDYFITDIEEFRKSLEILKIK